MNLAEAVRHHMGSLTQEELEDISGLSQTTISEILAGRRTNLHGRTLAQLAKVFKKAPGYFVQFMDSSTVNPAPRRTRRAEVEATR